MQHPTQGARHSGRGKTLEARLAALLAAFVILAPATGRAAVTATDVQVAARVLGFTTAPVTGTVKLGIVYDPANAASAADEAALLGILGSGLTVGAIKLIPVPVPIASISGGSADVLFLTSGLGTAVAQARATANAKKIICITTDAPANAAGYCAVAVQTCPAVKITINKAAATASNANFGTAFIMIITEI